MKAKQILKQASKFHYSYVKKLRQALGRRYLKSQILREGPYNDDAVF